MSLHVTHRISFLFGSSRTHLSQGSSNMSPELNLYYIICYLLPSYLLCVQECHGFDTATFLPSLTPMGPNPRGVLAEHTVLTLMHAWGVWRSLDSLVRQAKVWRNFMWISPLSLLWCGEKVAPAFSVAQFSPVLYYTLHQTWKNACSFGQWTKTLNYLLVLFCNKL